MRKGSENQFPSPKMKEYIFTSCELHFLCRHHALKLVSPDMHAEAIILICISGRQP